MNNKNIHFISLALLGAAFFIFLDGLFTVNQIEQVVVTRLGEPVRVIKDPACILRSPCWKR
ncbi:MAG: hypothetical protein LBJ16_00600 [Holosporaceae bacterium]|jgi:regulator of protease activity HflC (stomatin/prohibitin superfamily)|nr:hypothetical protein [Holosporaceae bacterium]